MSTFTARRIRMEKFAAQSMWIARLVTLRPLVSLLRDRQDQVLVGRRQRQGPCPERLQRLDKRRTRRQRAAPRPLPFRRRPLDRSRAHPRRRLRVVRSIARCPYGAIGQSAVAERVRIQALRRVRAALSRIRKAPANRVRNFWRIRRVYRQLYVRRTIRINPTRRRD